jgi:hypothetical protein
VTIVYFNRGAHPGWPVARRLPELREWSRLIGDAPAAERLLHRAYRGLLRDAHARSLTVPPAITVSVRGVSVGAWLRRKWRRLLALACSRLGLSATRIPVRPVGGGQKGPA